MDMVVMEVQRVLLGLEGIDAAHDPYSLDLVLQDAQNNRIQVYIKKEFMFRFEPLFEEGQCYTVFNFGIAENGGRLPLLPHMYKISFYKSTFVTRIEPFDNNTHGFVMEPYNRLLDTEHHHYYEQDAVDVIVSVVGIGDIVPVMSATGKKRVIAWTLPFGITGQPFGMNTVQDQEGYDANQLMIQHVAPEVKVVTVAEFFHRAVKKMVGGIRECDPDSHCIVYATIHRIHKEHGWAYTASKIYNKRVDIITHGNRKPTFVCDEHGNTQAASRFKVIVRLIDESGSALVVFFNTNFVKLSKHTTWELMEKYGMDTDDYFPDDLDDIVGKKYLFKVYYSEYNCNNNNHTYRCDEFSDDVGLIKHFKKCFLPDEVDNEQANEAPDEVLCSSLEEVTNRIVCRIFFLENESEVFTEVGNNVRIIPEGVRKP
ncbi:replication protein A 70 kDa DNA-binding subunit B [Tanacetum coccineum]